MHYNDIRRKSAPGSGNKNECVDLSCDSNPCPYNYQARCNSRRSSEDYAVWNLSSDRCLKLVVNFLDLITTNENLTDDQLRTLQLHLDPWKIPTRTWIGHLMSRGVAPVDLLVATVYLYQAVFQTRQLPQSPVELRNQALTKYNIHRALLTACILSHKFLHDQAMCISAWSRISEDWFPVDILRLCEREFLSAMKWKLYVSANELNTFVCQMDSLVRLHQYRASILVLDPECYYPPVNTDDTEDQYSTATITLTNNAPCSTQQSVTSAPPCQSPGNQNDSMIPTSSMMTANNEYNHDSYSREDAYYYEMVEASRRYSGQRNHRKSL
eukprot:TRINITY_DN18733_c0_g1::TRINITY_DN18733_c0_g1_i1::g.20379::m.20379 TRINITY_DN18733_c0_g1::TRINITY_DN18733_c0_g1_i1::g.20379  ORF type:complete len:326 (-),score=13.89,Cyclin/PF08613.6/0.0002,Cyclin_N/PF00134.18/5.6e+03,Cyclin_N/PF00134.18/0.0043 TRINITY_DN18733_c0_g1_i1:227-1204(-)